MSPKQNSLYWREWGAVHKTDPSIDRHELHSRALGRDKSHLLFTDRDFDKVLAEFRAITKPNSVDAQLRQLNQQKTRLIWKITMEQAALLSAVLRSADLQSAVSQVSNLQSHAYILAIIRDQFPSRSPALPLRRSHAPDAPDAPDADIPSTLHALTPQQLEHLRSTLAARINTLRRERGLTIHDMTILAGLQCNCRQCNPRPRLVLTVTDATGFHQDPQAGDYSNAPF